MSDQRGVKRGAPGEDHSYSRKAFDQAFGAGIVRSPSGDMDRSSISSRQAERPSFVVQPLERFQTKCAPFQQPTEIAYFSYNEKRELLLNNDDQLKWYYPPDLQTCDLSDGFPNRFIKRDSVPERLDALLHSLQDYNKKTDENGRPKLAPDFCTWRGIMTKIMCTPYSRDDWELGITKFNGTIYMEEHESDEKRQSNYGSSERDKLMTYWGYKFESLSTIDKPPSKITGSDDPVLKERLVETVDTNLQFCSVVKTKLGGKTLVLGAEVDCLTGDSKAPHERQKAYAELKTSRIISNDRQRNSFERHKLLKIWAQSFLSGVGTIIVGFRDDNGHVQTLQQLETLNIPRMVRNSQAGIWDATVCINFASSFLDWVQKVVATEDDADVVVTVRLSNGGKEVVIVRKEVGREGTEIFIPQWYRK